MGTMAVLKNYFREQHAERHAVVRHRLCPIEQKQDYKKDCSLKQRSPLPSFTRLLTKDSFKYQILPLLYSRFEFWPVTHVGVRY
jgi:hypothetical protein